MSTAVPMPDIQVARRTLQFIWLIDYSGSMSGKKIAILNQAIREALPELRKAVQSHPEVQIEMRAIKFASDAAWHVGPTPVPLEQFVWPELGAGGTTATAQAISLLARQVTVDNMPRRGFPPVFVLLSDGYCTDEPNEYENAIAELVKQPWGKKAVRLAIAIGEDSDYDEVELLKFVSHKEIGLLKAHSPEELLRYVKWASVSATVGASQGKSKMNDNPADAANVVLPPPPPPPSPVSPNDIF